MAVKKNDTGVVLLPKSTIIEVVSINGDKVYKKEMTYGEALKLQRKKGWRYLLYQKGFCTIQENK